MKFEALSMQNNLSQNTPYVRASTEVLMKELKRRLFVDLCQVNPILVKQSLRLVSRFFVLNDLARILSVCFM